MQHARPQNDSVQHKSKHRKSKKRKVCKFTARNVRHFKRWRMAWEEMFGRKQRGPSVAIEKQLIALPKYTVDFILHQIGKIGNEKNFVHC